jgi:uncharacterized damage-inducible protein DinB
MPDHPFSMSIETQKQFFDRATSCFDEMDSGFAPKPEMFTVAQHVAHVAQTIEWFMDGAFSPKGFSVDFEKHHNELKKVTSLKAAREWMDRATKNALEVLTKKTMADLHQPIAPGPIMGGLPRVSIFEALADHAAHHRGALSVYARLLGKVPPMPYM